MGKNPTKPNATELLPVGSHQFPTYNDSAFKRIRKTFGVPDDFLAQFSFDSLEAGGGKGGNLMGFTIDKRFIVKEINDTDHNTMLLITDDFATHLESGEGSLLARIFCHFQNNANGKNYMAMNNWFPTKCLSKDRYCSYDLKGSADDKTLVKNSAKVKDVHKRLWNIGMWFGKCAWSADRKEYYNGKKAAYQDHFIVTPEQHKWIMSRVTRDCEFLTKWMLMDYSLVVAIDFQPVGSPVLAEVNGSCDLGRQPLICQHGGEAQLLYVGIIDFLQDWTCGKKCAQCIKFMEFNKSTIPPPDYARRFVKYFDDKFETGASVLAVAPPAAADGSGGAPAVAAGDSGMEDVKLDVGAP